MNIRQALAVASPIIRRIIRQTNSTPATCGAVCGSNRGKTKWNAIEVK